MHRLACAASAALIAAAFSVSAYAQGTGGTTPTPQGGTPQTNAQPSQSDQGGTAAQPGGMKHSAKAKSAKKMSMAKSKHSKAKKDTSTPM